nr:thioredoxin-like protein 4a [Quercus suber]
MTPGCNVKKDRRFSKQKQWFATSKHVPVAKQTEVLWQDFSAESCVFTRVAYMYMTSIFFSTFLLTGPRLNHLHGNSEAISRSHSAMGSVVIPHLVTGWHVDQAIMSDEDRLVVIRFGRDWDPDCMRQDEVLYKIADRVKNFAVIYVCDLDQVPDFKQMYELYDTTTLMFFFRNKHMMCDFGTGNNNKLNWVLEDKQELIDIIETIYKGAKKGRGLVVSPKDYSTRYRY